MKRWRWMAGLLIGMAMGAANAAPVAVAPLEDTAAQIMRHAGESRLVVLGELHGTREMPQLVQALAEAYAGQGTPLHLGLELPATENARLATYLSSNGDAAARQAVRATSYWRTAGKPHDGRRNEDTLALIEAVRVLRAQGHDVQVVGFDQVLPAAQAGTGARDAAMADALRAHHATLPSDGRLLVLTGNVHAMRTQPEGLPWPPMTALLLDLQPYAVRVDARSGQAWGCTQHRQCGARSLSAYAGPSPLQKTGSDRSYDLQIWLPRFSVARWVE